MSPRLAPTRWLRWGGLAGVLVIGWLFIAWENRFHITAPLVFVCLGYLAVVAMVVNLWRTATSVVASDRATEEAWTMPPSHREELEKQKRTLLKAIKEAEFDQQMGKLSARDASEMIGAYRAQAIDVIKELDQMGGTSAPYREADTATIREQIQREVRARVELDAKTKRNKAGKKSKPKAATTVGAQPRPEAPPNGGAGQSTAEAEGKS